MTAVFPVPEGSQAAPQTISLNPCSWRVVGAAAIGISHKKQNLPCQDAQAYRLVSAAGRPLLLAAVADGAGSAEFSDRGAQAAVEAALQTLEAELLITEGHSLEEYAGLLYLAFESARAAVVKLAGQEELTLRSLATTLTCTLAHSEGVVAAQLGDGAVVALLGAENLLSVTQPQRGEYANETYFLTQEDALERLEIIILEAPLQGLAVMSDGLMRLAMQMPANEPHLPFFKPLFAFTKHAADPAAAARQLESFLSSERVCTRTDDDKSLVLAVCLNGSYVSTPEESRGQE
jgi:hypothetical protein